MRRSPTRRELLGAAGLAGLAGLAGCLSTASGATPEEEEPEPAVSPSAQRGPEPSASETTPQSQDEPEDLEQWLADANGYDGRFERVGHRNGVTVAVGGGHDHDDGGQTFGPAAIEVVPGTTVTWRWTGHGGAHNVVALDDSFDSGDPVGAVDATFSHTFEAVGEYPYVCVPHRQLGMRGAVRVREPPSTGYEEVDRWLFGSEGFEGELTDRTGTERTTVTVGAAGNSGQFAFDPLALRVDAGTTVAWEWTSQGGPHNVAFEEVDVESSIETEPGVNFEHTFEEPGVYRYACTPHRALGMRGVVIVE